MTKVAFYKAWKGNWTDWLIALWTWGKYSHVEIIMPDGRGFTASGRDNEVRIKKIDFYNGKWDIVVTSREIDREVLRKLLGHKYDKLGILFNEFLHIPVDSPYKQYCSEACSCVLSVEPCNIDPITLYKVLKDENERETS